MCVKGRVSPGKPPLSTAQAPLQGAGWVCQRHGPDEPDGTLHAESIITHNLVVLKQSLEDQFAPTQQSFGEAKVDVMEFTTLPVAGKPICECFFGVFRRC